MGWASGVNRAGREVGYGVEAYCDQDGCRAEINRGLDYVCGGEHDGGEHGCGRYFCGAHLGWADLVDVEEGDYDSVQLCEACEARFERAHPEREEDGDAS